jgi:hypothetical protein
MLIVLLIIPFAILGDSLSALIFLWPLSRLFACWHSSFLVASRSGLIASDLALLWAAGRTLRHDSDVREANWWEGVFGGAVLFATSARRAVILRRHSVC